MLKNFKLNILIRILLITVLIGFMLYFTIIENRYLRSSYLLVFVGILISEFVWYVNRTNRDFTAFLMALLQNDFTTTFSESSKGKTFGELYKAFNLITKKFKKLGSEKQAQHIYLETLVEHVKVGIISFDQNEKIQLMNESLKLMLGKPALLYLKSLQPVSEELVETLRQIKAGDRKLIKITINNELFHLAIHASKFKLHEDTYKLISIQNIKNELELNELDAWQKLIRVLTHEIMNSITPLTSLSGTLKQIAENEPDHPETITKVQQGLEAIHMRSAGLENFTLAYRKLTKIPTPVFSKINLAPLLKRVFVLLQDELVNVNVKNEVDDQSVVIGDPDLLEQVFINLIKNASDALKDTSEPILHIYYISQDTTKVIIADNGSGIETDKLDKIFIPFFSTKKDGSGIGLALSRQILRKHDASIHVTSEPGIGTRFTIEF